MIVTMNKTFFVLLVAPGLGVAPPAGGPHPLTAQAPPHGNAAACAVMPLPVPRVALSRPVTNGTRADNCFQGWGLSFKFSV